MKKVKVKKDFGHKGVSLKKGDVIEVSAESAEIFANNKLGEVTDDKVTVTPQSKPDVDEKKVTVEILKAFGFKGIGLTPGDKIEVLERVAKSWQGDGLAKIAKKKPVKKQETPKDKMVKESKNK